MSTVFLRLEKYELFDGDILRGQAICRFRSSKDIRWIRIRLEGTELTSWESTTTDSNNDTVRITHNASRDIIKMDMIIYRGGIVNPGDHVFPFHLPIPNGLPGSFQHQYGRIGFSVKLTVDRPWKTNYERKHEVIIFSPIKVEMFSTNLLEPAVFSDEKTICCWCCASGPIQLVVNLENRTFIIGQNPDINVYCVNMSNINVEGIAAQITRKWTFKAKHPSTEYKYDSELVARTYVKGVGAHGEKRFKLNLPISPVTRAPNFYGCQLFSSDTQLKVTAFLAGRYSNIEIPINVVLCHVPYLRAPQNKYEQSATPGPV